MFPLTACSSSSERNQQCIVLPSSLPQLSNPAVSSIPDTIVIPESVQPDLSNLTENNTDRGTKYWFEDYEGIF